MKYLRCILLAGLGLIAPLSAEVVYHEDFPDHRDPTRYTRIAAASEDWEILEENGQRFMRVHIQPSEQRRRGLVVWDLAPIHFTRLGVELRAVGTDGAPVRFSIAAQDRFTSSYVFKPSGPIGEDWTPFQVNLPADLERIFLRGKEISPFVHGRGDELTTWEGVDFSNIGFKTLFFHLDVPTRSPLLDKTYAVDFKLLQLSKN